jgi:acrylyl-CoA reductase (NADPH)
LFKALVLEKEPAFVASIREVDDNFLSEGDVTVNIEYSTLNYKDALAITNRSPVVRSWPMIAGIDGAGVVRESAHPDWKSGDRVVMNGFGVGETHTGCLAERARLKGDWLVRLPERFTTRQAMAIGTAGYTAMLCVMRLERHGLIKGGGEVLVTGATGGVGSIAIALLSKLGYSPVASTGKATESDYLKALGATRVIHRDELSSPGKPLQKERWSAAIDTVGGPTLANVLAQIRYGGAVASCGLAQSPELPITVMPFILRGVSLLGVDSVMAPRRVREEAWRRLASSLGADQLDMATTEIALSDAIEAADRLMTGRTRGRFVVSLSDVHPTLGKASWR